MAQGTPIKPISAFPVTATTLFSGFHVCAASTGLKYVEGIKVAASIGADATWALLWDRLPDPLPTGTLTLDVTALANATSGAIKFNPTWAMVATEEDPSEVTLNAEGTQTITWAAGDNDEFKRATVTLDADTPVADEFLAMHLVFETSGYTLAQVLTVLPSIRFIS